MKPPRCLPTLFAVVSLFASSIYPAFAQPPHSESSISPTGSKSQFTETSMATIPGPLRSFLRMAGISQKVSAEEVMPLLARNVFELGYEGPPDKARPTEFLILLNRYVQQARDLSVLAGPDGTIHVATCEQAKPLLQILGYRIRQDCGQPGTYVETADPARAFITIDSGFPLADLEKTLQGGEPFAYPYPASHVPVLFKESDWTTKESTLYSKDLVDKILRDRALARFYWSMARMDDQTRMVLRQSPGMKNLAPYAAVLDFYGSYLCIRGGRVIVPGGESAEAEWKSLVGASPDSPGEFVQKLVSKDRGWLAAYFDTLSRVNRAQQARFTEPHRLRRLYESLREHQESPEAARPVFRPAPSLLLLATRLQWEADGQPHVPGNLEVWKKILREKAKSKLEREWSRRAAHWEKSEQLLEAMFAFSREDTDQGPLQIFLLATELDATRTPEHHLNPETVHLLAERFGKFSNQYLVFAEFPALNDASIASFVKVADAIDGLSDHALRGNAMGIFEANIGIWQILARQRQIPSEKLNESWQSTVRPFAKITSSAQLFDAGYDSLHEMLLASTGKPNASQDEIIDLLAGPRSTGQADQKVHRELADRMRSVLDGQRLVSLDTILTLGNGLRGMDRVKIMGNSLLPLAGELREFEMPRPIFSTSERYEWATEVYNNHHTETQMRTDLTKVLKSPASPKRVNEARGQLTPFLRDTLVGLNYAYYEPPGAQMLHNNPLFVRSHDFSGETIMGMERVWQAPQLFGVGSPAGGGAHLVGSLADLPYVLAKAEQDFIAPENVQALIWQEVVPGLLTSAVVPRWWGVSRNELHAVALYQRAGEELLAAAVQNSELRTRVLNILADRMAPQRVDTIERELREALISDVVLQLMPADTFYLTAEFRRIYSGDTESWGPAGTELETLTKRHPNEVSWERLSRDFGVPHPVLTQNYGRELLNLEPFPAFTGYSSRLLAESWDSNNLYWARLADEQGYSPATLNRLVPELTRRMVEKIFATEFEDWPALLRAEREAGDEFRQGKVASLSNGGDVGRP